MDFSTPRVNMASYHLLMLSSILVVLSIAREEGIAAG